MDSEHDLLDTMAAEPAVSHEAPVSHRTFASHRLAVFATRCVIVAVVGGLGYLIWRQGPAATTAEAHGVAAAVKKTTAVVRETSVDAATTAKVKAALTLSKRTSAFDVNVFTGGATTTLTGTVRSFGDRQLVGQIAADTSGVRDVRNLLLVDPGISPEQDREHLAKRVTELEQQIAVAETLQASPELDGAKITVRVDDGIVTLDGTVVSDAQKARAEQIARIFLGVQDVHNRLKSPGVV